MYVFVTAKAVRTAQASRWLDVDLTTLSMAEIFTSFREAYITLTNSFLNGNIYVKLSDLKTTYATFQGTFLELLTSIGNAALPSVDTIPTFNPKYARFEDAFRVGYKLKPVLMTASDTANLPDAARKDIQLSRPSRKTDMGTFHKYCLVSINGYFHYVDSDGDYAYVQDGMKSMLRSRQNQIGLLSFLDIGQIQTVPLKASMLSKESPDSKYSEKTFIKLDQDLTNKTVLLVIGGHLVLPSAEVLYQSGDNIFTLNMSRVPYMDRYFESAGFLDYSSLNLDTSTVAPSQIGVEELYADPATLAYLTLSQSFVVIVDSPSLFFNRVAIRNSPRPGMFIAFKEPIYPLIVSNGKIAEYWKVKEDGQWAVNVTNAYLYNRVYNTVVPYDLITATKANVPLNPVSNSRGYLLEIGEDF